MGQGGISVVFVGFFAGEKEALEAADHDPNFFIPQGGISGGVGNNIQLWKEGFDPTTFFFHLLTSSY